MKLWGRLWDALVYLFLLLGGLTMLVPFFWMVSTSLKAPGRSLTCPWRCGPGNSTWRTTSGS